MGKSSQLSIDPDVKKWKVVSLWYVVFLIKFTLSNAEGRWSSFPPVLFKRRGVKRSIVPYCGPGSNNNIPGERLKSLRGGAAVNPFPSGYNPFGYALTDLGRQYLTFQGSTDSDVGRFLSTLKSGRKKETTIKEQWLEIVRISKQGQSMRVYRTLDDMIKFCLSAGFID